MAVIRGKKYVSWPDEDTIVGWFVMQIRRVQKKLSFRRNFSSEVDAGMRCTLELVACKGGTT